MPPRFNRDSSSASALEQKAESVFDKSSTHYDELDYDDLNNEYIKQQKILEKKERYKESFRPKKDVEESENIELPMAIKSKLEKADENLKQIHKENVALGYAVGMLNESVEKMQKDLISIANNVNKLKDNPYNALMADDEDENINTYEAKIDEDLIINNVLAKMKEMEQKNPKKSGKFKLSKKDLVILGVLAFLIVTNAPLQNFISNFIQGFNKEIVTTYKTKKTDIAVCSNKELSLKEGVVLKINDTGDKKIFFIGNVECYLKE